MSNIPKGFRLVEDAEEVPKGYRVVGEGPRPQDAPEAHDSSSWWGRFATGAADPIYGLSQLAQESMPAIKAPIAAADRVLYDITGGVLGRYKGIKEHLADREKKYKAALPEGEGFDEARLLGNLATSMAGTRGYAPTTLPGAIGVGAGMGLTEPVTSGSGGYWMDKSKQALSGAAGGYVGQKVGQGLGGLFNPKVSPEARKMAADGVELTPGQILGGVAGDIEQKATSIPFVGKTIADARGRAQEQFNIAALQDVTASIPHVIGPADVVNTAKRGGIKQADDLVKKAYKFADDSAAGFRLDREAVDSMGELFNMAKNLPEDEAKRFTRFFKSNVQSKLRDGGITSQSYKALDSQLRKIIEQTNQKEVGAAFKQLRANLKAAASRQNPVMAKAYEDADLAFAKLRTVQNAANRATTAEGQFTPSQLAQSARLADKSAGKNRYSKGESLMQNRAETAQKVIGDTVPDSGTAGRTAILGGLTGGGVFDPVSAAGAGSGLYAASKIMDNPTVQKNVRSFLLDAPLEDLEKFIDLERLGIYLGGEAGAKGY